MHLSNFREKIKQYIALKFLLVFTDISVSVEYNRNLEVIDDLICTEFLKKFLLFFLIVILMLYIFSRGKCIDVKFYGFCMDFCIIMPFIEETILQYIF